jgi:hypothetical protein
MRAQDVPGVVCVKPPETAVAIATFTALFVAFGDIRRNGNGGSSHLGGQAKQFRFWQILRQSINRQNRLMCLLPYDEISE